MGGSVECTTVFTCLITAFSTLSKLVPSFHQLYERLLWLAECIQLPAAGFLSTGHRCFGGLKGRGGGVVELCWAHFIV